MDQYHQLLRDIKEHGDGHDDRTGVGTQSLFGYQSRYPLAEGFPLMTTKRISMRWIAEELFWFLSGSTHVDHLRNRCQKPITIWDEWATEEQCRRFDRPAGELGPVYGHEWRNSQASRLSEYPLRPYDPATHAVDGPIYEAVQRRWINRGYHSDGFDQIRQLMGNLASEKGRLSRRLIVSGWNCREADNVALPPCHTLFHFKWHQESNKLDLQLYQRSCDVFLGVPYNIASYALLLQLVAKCCDMVPGDFIHTYGDVHIYQNHREQVQKQLSRDIRPLPQLNITIPAVFADETPFIKLMVAEWSWLELLNYDPHPSIEAEVAV